MLDRSMDVDSRGVKRGACTEGACHCSGYLRRVDGKCLKCSHVPVKHFNLGTQTVGVSSHLNYSPSTSGNSTLATGICLPIPLLEAAASSQSGNMNVQMYSGAGVAYSPTYQPAGSSAAGEDRNTHVTTMHERPSPKRPQCQADGCTELVFYDPELPEELATTFSYCSPHCRNVHLLHRNSATLVKDLKELKKELQGIVAAEKRAKPKQQTSAATSSVIKEIRQHSSNSTMVRVQKSAHKPFGLIVRQELWHSDEANGFMITGVMRGSPAAKAMEKNELMIFDVIQTVNSKKYSDILQSGKTPQECFDQEIASTKQVELFANHSLAIQSLSSTLSYTRSIHAFSTHIIVVKYSPESKDEMFGLSLNDSYSKVLVEETRPDTPSSLCGVEFSDKICMYALVSKGEIGQHNSVFRLKFYLEKNIKRAYQEKKSVLLLLERSSHTVT